MKIGLDFNDITIFVKNKYLLSSLINRRLFILLFLIISIFYLKYTKNQQ